MSTLLERYRAAVLADSPQVYYPCDEASGNLVDASGNSRTGTYTDGGAAGSSVSYRQDVGPFKGVKLTNVPGGGQNSAKRFVMGYNWATKTAWSVEAWVMVETTAGAGTDLISPRSYFATGTSDFPWVVNAGPSALSSYTDEGSDFSSPAGHAGTLANPKVLTPYHVCLAYQQNALSGFYVNGVATATWTPTYSLPTGSGRLITIGAAAHEQSSGSGGGGSGFRGWFTQVALYNSRLSEERIRGRYELAMRQKVSY